MNPENIEEMSALNERLSRPPRATEPLFVRPDGPAAQWLRANEGKAMTEMKKYEMTILCAPNDSNSSPLSTLLEMLKYTFSRCRWVLVPPTVSEYKKGGVIKEREPRVRDRFNPLFYIRKELQKMSDTFTQATDRIEQKIGDVNANLEALKANIAAEAAQFKAAVEELRGMSTNENLTTDQTARLSAIADQLDASATNIKAAADSVKGIVPDAPVVKEPPVDVDPPATPTPTPAPAPAPEPPPVDDGH